MEIRSLEQYHKAYKQSTEDPEGFWGSVAEEFVWRKSPDSILQWDFEKPEVKWFSDGQLNITENCLDRHLDTIGDQTAIIWESNDPEEDSLKISYRELHSLVCRFSNVLKRNGISKGDRVCIYMPMVPELAVAVLACARIGAVHSVVFAGFSSTALADRINDAKCNLVITADGSFRGKKVIDLKSIVDEGLKASTSVKKVIVLKRTGSAVNLQQGRDVWWHDEITKVDDHCPAEVMNAEDMLFILYTSGSTGKPKGMVHTCGGYMVFTTYTFKTVFQYQPGDVYWCTADIGWITGHSYIVYGPLSAGATTVMFEGVPSFPDMGRFWEVVAKHRVNIFYTAPTAIRALEKADLSYVNRHDLSSLKVLGTVGEPINEEAWHWYDQNIGKGKCPIVDTWWQTETGGIMISPIAGITPVKPTYATFPIPGIQPVLIDEGGSPIEENDKEGRLCIGFPWPSMARTIYGNHQRYKETYFSAYSGYYFTGDGCKRDKDGMYRITGRVDDVIIVSGHNLGTAEIESAIDEHHQVVETAVVGFPHDLKGNAVYAFVITRDPVDNEEQLRKEILSLVSDTIGPIAKPDKIQFVAGLPKTRSGKIMRRILRKIASRDNKNLGDISTLLDPSVVESIKQGAL
ncbi:MAG: acetyl-coenzyme A synthetase [Cyclobacteriaceae bacterium]|nr:MAG: acetyl-coenzyme A synthetase [Cyclobacteriaceae bacterium]